VTWDDGISWVFLGILGDGTLVTRTSTMAYGPLIKNKWAS